MTMSNKKSKPPQLITNQEFLEEIFGEEWGKAHVTSFTNDPSDIPQEWRGACWAGGMAKNKLSKMTPEDNQYYTISLFNKNAEGIRKRQKSLFDATFVIVVDDVFEKIPKEAADKLPEPSYKLLTSAGSHQWGYILSEPDSDANRVNNLLDGLIAKGLAPDGKDTGMKGVTRYIRLPEGSNTKASRRDSEGNAFKCELYEWQPQRTYSLDQLAFSYDINVNAERASNGGGVGVPADMYEGLPHPILDVVNVTGYGSNNWIRIDCVNAAKHTGDDASGAAIQIQADGRINYECHHGACQGSTKAKKLTGVEAVKMINKKQKGFSDKYDKHREDIVLLGKANLLAMVTKDLGTAEDIDRLTNTIPEQPCEKDGIRPEDYFFVKPSGSFFEKKTGTVMAEKSLNALYKKFHTGAKGEPLASTIFTRLMDSDTMAADGFTWHPTGLAPVTPEIVKHEGRNMINTWRGLPITPMQGDVQPWIDMLNFIVRDEMERHHVLQWIANLVQNIGQKPNWQLLILGTHRNGKDSLFKPISRIFGGSAGDLKPEDLKKGWGDFIAKKKFLCIQEIYQPQNKEFANNIKTLAAGTSSGSTKLNMKGGEVVEQTDSLGFVGFSNHRGAMVVEQNDQRYFGVGCFFPPAKDKFYIDYYDWLDGVDGKSLAPNYLLDYLLKVDLSDFSPARAPYITDIVSDLVKMGKPDYEQVMSDLADEKAGIFINEVFTLSQAHTYMKIDGSKMGRNGIANSLRNLGYNTFRGQCKIDRVNYNTPRFYTFSDLSGLTAKDIYDYYVEALERQKITP